MKKNLITFDYYFQLIAFTVVSIASFTLVGLMLLVPFGAYQVGSAALKGWLLESERDRIFAMVAGTYGTALVLIFRFEHELRPIFELIPEEAAWFMAVIGYIIIPFTSAVYYIRQTRKHMLDSSIEVA